jgi:hypothetical protein
MPVAVSHLAKANGRALPTCSLPLPQRLLAEDTFQFVTLNPQIRYAVFKPFVMVEQKFNDHRPLHRAWPLKGKYVHLVTAPKTRRGTPSAYHLCLELVCFGDLSGGYAASVPLPTARSANHLIYPFSDLLLAQNAIRRMVGEYLVLATIDAAERQNVPVGLSACHRKTLWLCGDVERKLAEAYAHDRYSQVILRRPRRPSPAVVFRP